MNKSNIFVYIELSKMLNELNTANSESEQGCKKKLIQQSSYFKIIDRRFFSTNLEQDWERILNLVSFKGGKLNERGKQISSPYTHTIESLTEEQCQQVIGMIADLHERVKSELFDKYCHA